jgi:4-amino-4-deoxy-L-arabinose transferase-like glycosyltransferase
VRQRPNLALSLILSLYLLLAVGYGVINPLFEAPDEQWHYFTAQYIADTGRLPAVASGAAYDEWLGQEAAQPPLYYLLGAALIAPIDTTGAREAVWLNPTAWIGDASALANINRMVHTPQEGWPWRGYALAAHLLRLLSALFGLGTLLCVYASGRLLWPTDKRPPLLATAMVAFLPQFGFIHGAISNDTLITLLASAALWQLLRLWLGGVTRRRLLLLGITIGLAVLTKNAGVLLLGYAAGVLFLLALRDGRSRLMGETALFVILPVLLIAGWLWWRNWVLYGDWTAANQFIRIAGGDRHYTLWQALGESGGLWLSLFAVFGWFNVRAPSWIYWVWNGLVALATIGALGRLSAWRAPGFNPHNLHALLRRRWMPALLLALWVAAVYAGLLLFLLQTEAAQGRLLFPALTPLALGLAYGLVRLPWRGVVWAAPLLALVTTLYALFFVIRPAYAPPPILQALPAAATPLGLDMGDGLRLMGAEIETAVARPGDIVRLALYWQAETVPAEAPQVALELFGRDLAQPIAAQQSYHGRGLYPASLWPEGRLIAERVAVRIQPEVDAPVLARAFVRLDGEGYPSADVGTVKIVPTEWPAAAAPALAHLGDAITLAAVYLSAERARPGEQVEVRLQWWVTAEPGGDFTTLIHLAEVEQPPLATGDSPPRGGHYPTRVWAAGEVIEDGYLLALPADLPGGRYPVWVGMYNPASATLERLPLTVEGVRQPGDLYLVGWLEVSP